MTTTAPLADREVAADADAEFARIVDELTRRGFLGGALGVAAAAGLVACGSSSGSHPASGAPASATRQVSTAKGPIHVPGDPRRVVTIQPSATATLYDLGLNPIGVYDQGAQYMSPRYLARWNKAPKIGNSAGISVEKVAALNPDLIVGVNYDWNTSVYGQLSKLAPTVIAPATTWQAISHTVADAVNRLAKLTALQQQLAARSAAIKSQYAGVLSRYRWDILQGGFDAGQYWLYGPGSDAGAIMAGAGIRFATGSAGVSGNGNRSLSYERIDLLSDADVIGFYANYDGTPNNEGPALFKQTAFRRLRAAQQGHLVPIPDFLPGGYGDALAILDEVEAGLKKLPAN